MPDPAENAAVVDLLGLHSFIQLAAFTRFTKDAQHAPDLPGQVTLSRMAAGELAHLDQLERLVTDLGGDFYTSMGSYAALLGDFDQRTAPGSWWERLMRTYVAFGVLADLQRALSTRLDATTGAAVEATLADSGHGDFVVAALEPVIAAEPQLAARLALWGRRVGGEALGIAQHALAEHPLLLAHLDDDAAAGGGAAWVRNKLSTGHARRMDRLGLTA
ncbi:ferritin-like fold-containing protein [Georgenia sp. SYP-B2076]|uniref:ferritin-like fold-containing protein n=1 Tax=Georgenia sp. SYP-B2076 TaxID=2495881 RepID=UPI000F8D4894|nr:ferritin-like fold-containing protein [Georgenia sp. SYP-B2076]